METVQWLQAFALTRAGIDSQTLEGGLAGWNQILKPITASLQTKSDSGSKDW